MATHLPAKLKTADIQRFAVRAAQLETAKPAIAYWCEYWIVNHILAKGLHNSDGECLQYTTTLMDKLEQTKSKNPTDDAIVDDTAGQAYVEQFGLETFDRADRAVAANKVTRQTADTFLAASTFLELLNIWGEPEPEIQTKIRYAKWNAGRIAKALREGKDPNESNPKPEPSPEEELPPLDPGDPEVQELSGGGPTAPRQAFVEEVPDEQDRVESRLAAQSILDRSLHPSAQPSARGSPGPPEKFDPYPRSGFPYSTTAADHDVSPLDPSDLKDPESRDRNDSVGGGYFPEVPTFTADTRPSNLPTAPADLSTGQISPPDPPSPFPHHPDILPSSHGHFEFQPPASPNFDSRPVQPPPPQAPQDFYRPQPLPPQQPLPRQPPAPPQRPSIPAPLPAPVAASVHAPVASQALRQQAVVVDDVAISKAQKHARFAISALTFDDPATAIKELRAALQTLGAQ